MKGALDQKNKKTKDFLAILLKPHVFEEEKSGRFPPLKRFIEISKFQSTHGAAKSQIN